jgi:hypothetical protein
MESRHIQNHATSQPNKYVRTLNKLPKEAPQYLGGHGGKLKYNVKGTVSRAGLGF